MANDEPDPVAQEESPASPVLAWLQLLRAPNVFSALADIFCGFLLVQQALQPGVSLAVLAAASAALYLAGMVLNDVYDLAIDVEERPERPIPSGRIPLEQARAAGWGLLCLGVLLGWVVGFLPVAGAALPWRPGMMATLIAVAVWLYDGLLKATPAGPFVMGLCRALNLLLGMSAATTLPQAEQVVLLGYGLDHLLLAGGMGLYIAGVTWFARQEASEEIDRWQLLLGIVLMLAGVAIAGTFILNRSIVPGQLPPPIGPHSAGMWLMLLLVLALTVVGRCAMSLGNPSAQNIQQAVVQCLRSYIVFLAALILAAAPTGYAFAILLLLLPAYLLGRVVYST